MEIQTNSTAILAVVLAASATLFAQNTAPTQVQTPATSLNAREIISLSVAATERSWRARDHYNYLERDEDRRVDPLGQVKTENISLTRMIVVNNSRFEQLVEQNGQPPSAEEGRRQDEELLRLNHETPEEQASQIEKDEENRSFLRDVLDAFDFQLIGEENVGDRAAYVFRVTPHPGYRAHGKYAKFFANVEGKLWVDKRNFGWIKVDGQVTRAFSIGLFVARVQRGSHIILEETCVGDDVWVPSRVEVRASARILFVKSLDIQRVLTYSDYRPAVGGPYSVSK